MKKPMTRKRMTVDVKERREVSYRIGQEVWDCKVGCWAVVEAMTPDGTLLHSPEFSDEVSRWFRGWEDIRPTDGTHWL